MLGRFVLKLTNFIGQAEAFPLPPLFSRSALPSSATHRFLSLASRVRDHGRVPSVIRKSAGLCLPLLRPHGHSRLPERAVPTRAGGVLPPSGSGPPRGEQRSAQATHPRLPRTALSLLWKPMWMRFSSCSMKEWPLISRWRERESTRLRAARSVLEPHPGCRSNNGSPSKGFRWHSCFCSSTSAFAALWPTAAFTTLPTQFTHPTANSRPPITRLTRPSRT